VAYPEHSARGQPGAAVRDAARDRVDAVAREVQRRAVAELRRKVGLQDVTVNVTVDDVIT